MEDKRKFIRFGLSLDAQVSADGDPSVSNARMIDISRQGVALSLDPGAPFDQAKTLKIKTHLPDELLPFMFEGRVVWVRQSDTRRIVGLELQVIEPRVKSRLLEYAYKRWQTWFMQVF